MRFTILSSGPEPWGGSEELWWRAAVDLRERGHDVDVLKTVVDDRHPRIRALRARGCQVRDLERARIRRLTDAANVLLPAGQVFNSKRRQMIAAAAALTARRPALAIVSQGQNFDGGHLALLCDWLRIPYVLVAQKASETHWPADWSRQNLQRVFLHARRCIFVSDHNRRLTEHQIALAIDRATVLPNPVLVDRDEPLPWPNGNGTVRLACVARLFPAEKGQDLLLNVLATERWRERPVRVSFFGEGVNREALVGMAGHLGLRSVSFDGQVADITSVWRTHQALVLASRAEGQPLSILEAMACGRVPIVTAVGGSAEVVEDGVTGFVAAAPTFELVEATLERAWAERHHWPAMGAAAARSIADLAPQEQGASLAEIAEAEAG